MDIALSEQYCKTGNLEVGLKKYRETSGALEEALKDKEYTQIGATQILVKDYWQTSKESQNEEKLFVFFHDLTAQAARNSSFMI